LKPAHFYDNKEASIPGHYNGDREASDVANYNGYLCRCPLEPILMATYSPSYQLIRMAMYRLPLEPFIMAGGLHHSPLIGCMWLYITDFYNGLWRTQ
jgi:hypothetical protein